MNENENKQVPQNAVDEAKQAGLFGLNVTSPFTGSPIRGMDSEQDEQQPTADELKEQAREARAYHRAHKKRLQAREEAIKKGDVATTLQLSVEALAFPSDVDLVSHKIKDPVAQALNTAYDQGGALQMAEAALKPGLLVLGQTIACCAALIKRNGIFELGNQPENPQLGAVSNYLGTLETACESLVKLAKNLSTAKHAAQLATAQNDGDPLPWKQPRHTRLSGKRYPRMA